MSAERATQDSDFSRGDGDAMLRLWRTREDACDPDAGQQFERRER
jgi:hypothetical protein